MSRVLPSVPLQMAVLPTHGDVEVGSIWYLKGAARIQTAMAVVVALDRMGKEARYMFEVWTPN